MVNNSIFLPDADGFSCLDRLYGEVSIWAPSGFLDGVRELVLRSRDGFSAKLFSDYTDVVFKFECFGLKVEECLSPLPEEQKEIFSFKNIDVVRCFFRFEWERPALQGEVPRHWEQIVRRRGKRCHISTEATSICVSMVGIYFMDSSRGNSSLAIFNNDNDPATMLIYPPGEGLDALVAECECIDLVNVRDWIFSISSENGLFTNKKL